MFNFWADDPTLMCVAFLLPGIVNLSVLVCLTVASRFPRIKRAIAITGGGIQLFTLFMVAKAAIMALMVEMTVVDTVFYSSYFIAGAALFVWSLYVLADALGNRGDNDGWDDDDDDGPDPDPPLPTGPCTGLTLQTGSSQRLQNNHVVCAAISPVGVEIVDRSAV